MRNNKNREKKYRIGLTNRQVFQPKVAPQLARCGSRSSQQAHISPVHQSRIMPSLQDRIDRALELISNAVNIIHVASLLLIALAAFLLSLLFFYIYPPLVFLVLLVALCAVYYVNSKKDAITELIVETDDEKAASSLSQRESSNDRPQHNRFARRLIFKLVDSALDVGRDYALAGPLVVAAVAVVAAIFKYYAVATTFTILAAVLLAIVCCGCHITKYLAHSWVDYFFDHDPAADSTAASSTNYPRERSPLLPKS